MKTSEQAILNAVRYLRTQPDCKTAADLLMKKFMTEKLKIETSTIRITSCSYRRRNTA